MEHERQNQPEFKYRGQPNELIDPIVLNWFVWQQINAILKACEQQQWRKDNMNA